MSLTQILMQALELAAADAERQTAREAQLGELIRRLDDQSAMDLELADAVKALGARLDTLLARWESIAKPPTLAPPEPIVTLTRGNGAPAKRLPRPANVDYEDILDRYLQEKNTTIGMLAEKYGLSRKSLGEVLLATAQHRGPTAVSAYHRAARDKKGAYMRTRTTAMADQLGRTTPPGAGGFSPLAARGEEP